MKLEISKSEVARMRKELRDAGSREIGGVLMAEQLDVNHFRIDSFSVDSRSGGFSHFIRSVDHHDRYLEDFFRNTGKDFSRFNYLGEWHSHPSFSVHPSAQDIASMEDLVASEDNVSFAILIVVKLKFFYFLQNSATVFIKNGSSYSVRLEIK